MLAAMIVGPSVPERISALASRLADVPGVVAVVLGGSRATGEHRPDSDVDLGLYYRGRLDVAALRALAAEVAEEVLGISDVAGWGPWMDGGAWLVIDGTRVDWIYRDLDRVSAIWSDCRAGRYEVGHQGCYVLGFYSHTYAAEAALCRVLADPGGELTRLHVETQRYPDALGDALVASTWEPAMMVAGAAGHAVKAADPSYTAGCLFRAIGVLAQALHGHHRRWVLHEKRLIDAAGRLPAAPPDFARRAHGILGRIGTTSAELAITVAAARELVDDTIARLAVRAGAPPR